MIIILCAMVPLYSSFTHSYNMAISNGNSWRAKVFPLKEQLFNTF